MIFRQLFDSVSGTYTYLLASRRGGEALIIDPVLEKVDRYIQLIERARPQAGQGGRHPPACRPHHRARRAARPHPLHHRDGRAAARSTWCRCGSPTATSSRSRASRSTCSTRPATPTIPTASCMRDRVFTGDTLLIRGTGRTDFQNGDPRAQYESIFNKLLRLPDETMVFPAHDYKGETVSTIGEEKAFNPRLQVKSIDEYVDLMSNLNLPNPKMMDVAVPANMRVGLAQEEIARRGWAVSATEAHGARRPAGRGARRPARADRAREARRHPGLAARPLPRPRRTMSAPAACCTSSPAPPASASCSTAPSASARRWRCRPRRMPALPPPATSRAASTPGRRPTARWRVDFLLNQPAIDQS